MSHAALPGAEVALPEPPHPEGAAAGPAGGDLPHYRYTVYASPGTTGTGAVDRMCCRPGVLVAAEVSVVLEEVSCAGRGSGG